MEVRPISEPVGSSSRRAATDPTSLPGWVARHAETHPRSTFLRHRDRRWSYGAAADEMLRVGAGLRRLDPSPGARIAMYLPNGPEAVFAWLGAQAVGLVPVTINREQKGAVLADVVTRAGASVVVTDAAGLAELASASADRGLVPVLVGDEQHASAVSSYEDLRRSLPASLYTPDLGDPATILFTSGSTGRSKGVVVPHGMFVRGTELLAHAWQIDRNDVFHCWAPYYHIAAQLDFLGVPIRAGAVVALFDGFSLSRFWDQIRDAGATVCGGFVATLELLHAAPRSPRDRDHRLRLCVAGHMPAALRRRFESRFGVPILDLYGMSEAEPLTVGALDDEIPDGSCGRSSPDFDIAIHDSEGRPVATGQVGRIVFRPRREHVMMLGYLDDPQANQEAWREGWFLTSDLGRLDDRGRLYFVERMADFLRVRGENVSAQEVESVLIGHPGVAEVAVVGVPSELGEHEVKAVIVPAPGADLGGLPAWCAERMAKFMVPRWYHIVAQIPRTETGKPLRRRLVGTEAIAADELERR